jgi:signal peptidase II
VVFAHRRGLRIANYHPPMNRRWIDPLFLGVAATIYVLDQVTKEMAIRGLGPAAEQHSVQVLSDYVRLSYTTNTGAAFGMFQSQPIVFTLIALVAIPVIWTFNRTMSPRTILTRACMGGLLGGALGNLTDRLRLGHVTDFVDVGIGDLRWPAFNVADSAFVVGIFALTVLVFLFDQRRSNQDEPAGDRRYA